MTRSSVRNRHFLVDISAAVAGGFLCSGITQGDYRMVFAGAVVGFITFWMDRRNIGDEGAEVRAARSARRAKAVRAPRKTDHAKRVANRVPKNPVREVRKRKQAE